MDDISQAVSASGEIAPHAGSGLPPFGRQAAACIADTTGMIVYVNEFFCRLLGYTQDELLNKNAGFLKSADQPELAFAGMRAALDVHPARQEIIGFVRKDGRNIWLEATLAPVVGAQGGVCEYILLLADITAAKDVERLMHDANQMLERQVAERTAVLLAELLKSREQLGRYTAMQCAPGRLQLQYVSILNSAGEGIYGLDGNGNCSFVNPAAARMLGWEVDDLVGRPLHDLMHHTHPDGRPYPASECPTRIAMRAGRVSQVDNEVFWRRDGTCFDVTYTTTPIKEGERIVGAVVVFSDISERKMVERALQQNHEELLELNTRLREAQNQLLQSEKLASIGQLAAGVAHEINNPIGFIHSNLGTLGKYLQDVFRLLEAYEQAEPSLAAEERENIRALRGELDIAYLREDAVALQKESEEGLARVKKIVQDLRGFSQVDESAWQWADLHHGLENTLNVVRSEIERKAEVVRNYGDLPQVECLPSQLNQVFMNLLLNAAEAIDGHGVITIGSGVDGGEVWVEIGDNGRGIPQENLSRIFDPFFTTKPVGSGTGLGLSLSYGIVEKHHGRIILASEVGTGTTFRIYLPVRQPDSKEE